jgi:hypothetical protein
MDGEGLKKHLGDLAKHLEDPMVLGAVGAGLLLLIVLVVALARRKRAKGQVFDDTVGRARAKLRGDLRSFRDELQRAIATAGPVFRKIDASASTDTHIGRSRKQTSHRIQVKAPDLGTLKTMARTLGYDSMSVSQLEAHWRKVERLVLDYNSGRLDDSNTPIASVKQIEKDLQSTVVLVNICLTAVSK